MKYLLLLALVALPVAADEYQTVYVPKGKKVVIVDKDVDSCVEVKAVKLEKAEAEPKTECDEGGLVVGPTVCE